MKIQLAIITLLIAFITTSKLRAQSNPQKETSGLSIISGFKGGSNYQMALDMQDMLRPKLGHPHYKIEKHLVPVLNANGDTIREEPSTEGELGTIKMIEKEERSASKDTIDFLKVLDSEGSYFNFLKVNKASADIAFIQYDLLLYEAMQDLRRQYKKSDHIRVLLPMGTEEIHIITLREGNNSDIKDFNDLKKKRVGIGSSLMGTNITAKYIKEVTGVQWEDVEIPFNESLKALFNGSIDAFFYVGAKPVKDIMNIPEEMEDLITLIPIPRNKVLDNTYDRVSISPDDYKWLDKSIETYAVRSLLVTSIAGQTPEDEENIFKLLQCIKANKDKAGYHSNWKDIEFSKDEKIDWEYYPAALRTFN